MGQLAATAAAWVILNNLGLQQSALPIMLAAWGGCFVIFSEPVTSWFEGTARNGGPTLHLVLLGLAAWLALSTTGLPSIYPVVIAAIVLEFTQRNPSRSAVSTGIALMLAGTVAAQVGVHAGLIGSVFTASSSDHLAVALAALAGVLLLRGVATAKKASTALAALAEEQRLRHEELHHAATHDALTGLFSRAGLQAHLAKAAQAAAPGRGTAVMFLDLDGFKTVNDAHGHEVGDLLLTAVGLRFTTVLGRSAALGRIGGDEFVAVVEDLAGERAALSLVTELQHSLADPIALEVASPACTESVVVEVNVGVSVGLAWTEEPVDPQDLMRRADTGMYDNKRARRTSPRPLLESGNQHSVRTRDLTHSEDPIDA